MAQPNSQTAVVDLNDPLKRKAWMLEGMLQKASNSFWAPFKGTSKDSVVFTTTDISKGAGHEVEFQFNANASGKGVKGKERLRGNEEQKKQFSDMIRVDRVRHGLDNGDVYDAIDIGNVPLSFHENSRALLADWNVRKRDQWLFDAAQGFLNGEGNTHIIRPNDRSSIANLTTSDTMSLDFVYDVEAIVKSSRGYTTGGARAPLEPYTLSGGERVWLWMLDSNTLRQMMKDSTFQAVMARGDYRGADNRLIRGALGKIGSFLFIEAPDFHGFSDDNGLVGSEVEISGMRQVHESGIYTGETGFETTTGVIASRSMILGAGALQVADGKAPDYKWKGSDDYDITSGSAIEMYTNTQSTILYANTAEYRDAKRAGFQYGMIAVDTYARAIS